MLNFVKIPLLVVLVGQFALFLSCNRNKALVISEDSKFKSAIAYSKSIMGTSIDILPNRDTTYLLVVLPGTPTTEFVVIDLDQNIVHPRTSIRGKISWHTNHSLAILEQPGVIEDKSSKPSDYIRIVEIKKSN